MAADHTQEDAWSGFFQPVIMPQYIHKIYGRGPAQRAVLDRVLREQSKNYGQGKPTLSPNTDYISMVQPRLF
jgi:hypothetical protein